MTKPWDRLHNESAPAREAFLKYRDLGAQRSTTKVSRELGKSKPLMDRWCRAHGWVERAKAWDAHLEELLQARVEAELDETAKRHIATARALQDVPVPFLNELTRRAAAGDLAKELEKVPAEKVAETLARLGRVFKVGVDVERLSSGQPTDRMALEGTPGRPVQVVDPIASLVARDPEARRLAEALLKRSLQSAPAAASEEA
jgi:hypothetical protein